MLTPEQFIAAQQTNLDAAFGLGTKVFEGFEKLVELNVQAAKTTLSESADAARAALAAKDPQQALAVQSSLLKPSAEKLSAYSRHVYNIVSSTATEVGQFTESLTSQAQKNFAALVEEVAAKAPAGSENVVALVKSSVAAATNAFEGVQKAAKQAADVAEANFTAATESALKATKLGDRAAA